METLEFNSAQRPNIVETEKSYLKKCMEAWLLFLTSNNSILAHFKKVDKRGIGFHQLFRLRKEKSKRPIRKKSRLKTSFKAVALTIYNGFGYC